MFRSVALTLTLCLATITAQAALLGRAALTPGGIDYQAYYDTDLNITWLANANLAASNTFGVSGIEPSGGMFWDRTQPWITAMNSASYLGVSDWRLPKLTPMNGVSFNYSYVSNGSTDVGFNVSAPGTEYAGSTRSELAHLFYTTLGNKSVCNPALSTASTCSGPQAGYGLINSGPFANFEPQFYWFGLDYAPNAQFYAWMFYFDTGIQGNYPKNSEFRAWAVLDGDISPIPLPPAVWLFGSALGVMGWMRRKQLKKHDV